MAVAIPHFAHPFQVIGGGAALTNLITNPRAIGTTQWVVRGNGDENFTAQAGEGKGGLGALRVIRDAGGGAETVYVQSNPGVASNGENAPDVSAFVGKWAVCAFEARCRDIARKVFVQFIFVDAAKALIGTPSGVQFEAPLSADPDETVRCWAAAQIPVGTVTCDPRYSVGATLPGEGYFFSQFVHYIADSQPLSDAKVAPYWPTDDQLESEGATWAGTPDASVATLKAPLAKVATVEQDSEEEILACVEAVLSTRIGSRLEEPEFGIPDQLFELLPPNPNVDDVLAAIELWEPRARVLGEAEVEELTQRVLIELERV
jgi:phage baseplate assembly protein W